MDGITKPTEIMAELLQSITDEIYTLANIVFANVDETPTQPNSSVRYVLANQKITPTFTMKDQRPLKLLASIVGDAKDGEVGACAFDPEKHALTFSVPFALESVELVKGWTKQFVEGSKRGQGLRAEYANYMRKITKPQNPIADQLKPDARSAAVKRVKPRPYTK